MEKHFPIWAQKTLSWIQTYRKKIRSLPVLSQLHPGEIRNQLPFSPPSSPETFETVLKDFNQILLPGITHWNHPRFFGYFSANNSPPSILAEMMTAAIGAQCMSWQTSPAATELEQVVMGWLQQMVGLPKEFTGVIQDSASSATLSALLVARERATEFHFKEKGGISLPHSPLRVYASDQAHSSVEKGVSLSGMGRKNLVLVPSDSTYSMKSSELEKIIRKDQKNGFVPTCVVATIGTTSSTANDPLMEIGKICQQHKIFLHVDAAFSGSAAILPEKRCYLDGVEYADSFLFNPHKWLFTNFDCTAFYVKNVTELLQTFSMGAEYLKTEYDDQVVNYRDWGIPLGRRFRALKLWFVLRMYGIQGLQEKLRQGISLAQRFSSFVDQHPSFERLAPVTVSLVCFRYHPKGKSEEKLNGLNQKLLKLINSTGKAFLTHTVLSGKFTLRMNTSGERTTQKDVDQTWNLIQSLVSKTTI